MKQKSKKYYEENKEPILEYQKKYREQKEHKAKMRDYQREYVLEHAQDRSEYFRLYYKLHCLEKKIRQCEK